MATGERTIVSELWGGIRDGTAGFLPRVGLSIAGAAAGLGGLMFLLGLLEASSSARRIMDWHIAMGVLAVVVAWLGLLYVLWSSYSRWRHTVRAGFICLGIIAVSVCIAFVFGAGMRNPEFFIAATLFFGAAGVGGVITAAVYRGMRGRAILGPEGHVDVKCPRCGYSMSGLGDCSCPECGGKWTLDELIRAQNYEGVRAALLAQSIAGRSALPEGAGAAAAPESHALATTGQ
ncbi:MAG: hypothetical protein WD749_10170 [Phycisphaerales bacterium]